MQAERKQHLTLVGTTERHRKHRSQVAQKLMIRERALQQQINALRAELREVRNQIRHALEDGAEPEPGLRTARIEVRKVLIVR